MKKATEVGVSKARPQVMVPVAMPTVVLAACGETDHPAATARLEMATKDAANGDLKAHRLAMVRRMAPVVNTVRTRQVPVPITRIHPAHPPKNQIRKKATASPTPLFKSLLLAPGPASLGPSQHGTGLLHLRGRLSAIVPKDRAMQADFHPDLKLPSRISEIPHVPATFVAARNRPIYTEIRHFRA